MELKEVKVGVGLGALKFGMSREQVVAALGQPDEKDTFSDEGEEEGEGLESWEYYDLELSLSFSEDDDWRLCIISTMSDEVTLNGKTIIGIDTSSISSILKAAGITDFEIEDFDDEETPNLKLLSSNDSEMNFWIDSDIVTEVQWGPLFIDDETIKWPN